MTNMTRYCYFMSFGLKNEKTTYQRLMEKIFVHQLGRNLEVYVYMVVKSMNTTFHIEYLPEIRKQCMRLNLGMHIQCTRRKILWIHAYLYRN